MNANDKIFVTSVSKAVDRAKYTGQFNTSLPQLYHIGAELIQWIDELQLAGINKYQEERTTLQEKLVTLKYRFPQEICNYKTTVSVAGYVPNVKPWSGLTTGGTPSLTGVNITLLGNTTYSFQESDFTTNYSDPAGAIPKSVILYISSAQGSFTFDNTPVSGTFEFNINNVGKLKYTRATDTAFNTSFTFRVINDMGVVSGLVTNNISGTNSMNQPATINDSSIQVNSGVTTTLTLAMFTAGYSDPEGDLIDAIRIDDIHSTNEGIFYLDGIQIQEGQIITREELAAGLFTHVGPNVQTVATDSFLFSVRDEGSGIWVQ